jgi:hypothetical protein
MVIGSLGNPYAIEVGMVTIKCRDRVHSRNLVGI